MRRGILPLSSRIPITHMTRQRAIVTTVITALLIDLLAFTIILPLFPRLLNYYREQESDEVCILYPCLPTFLLSTTSYSILIHRLEYLGDTTQLCTSSDGAL